MQIIKKGIFTAEIVQCIITQYPSMHNFISRAPKQRATNLFLKNLEDCIKLCLKYIKVGVLFATLIKWTQNEKVISKNILIYPEILIHISFP